jgi:uncharacterized peroxidase-related enzyme
MNYLPISGFPVIELEGAAPEIAQLYAELQQETQLPFVPNWGKTIINSPAVFDIYLQLLRSINQNLSLPQSLIPMILYAVAMHRQCAYCSASNELFCRTLGVDEATLEMVAEDLDNISPQRLRAIIHFALQCAFEPQRLTAADYDRVREEGVSEDEMMQIIFLAALGNFNDTLADSLKIEPEPAVLEALGR